VIRIVERERVGRSAWSRTSGKNERLFRERVKPKYPVWQLNYPVAIGRQSKGPQPQRRAPEFKAWMRSGNEFPRLHLRPTRLRLLLLMPRLAKTLVLSASLALGVGAQSFRLTEWQIYRHRTMVRNRLRQTIV